MSPVTNTTWPSPELCREPVRGDNCNTWAFKPGARQQQHDLTATAAVRPGEQGESRIRVASAHRVELAGDDRVAGRRDAARLEQQVVHVLPQVGLRGHGADEAMSVATDRVDGFCGFPQAREPQGLANIIPSQQPNRSYKASQGTCNNYHADQAPSRNVARG